MKKSKGFLLVLIVLTLMFTFVSCDMTDYSKAEKCYENGDYKTALRLFESLGDYKDSLSYVELTKVEIAKADFEFGKFDEAEAQFEEVYNSTTDDLLKTDIAKYLAGIDRLRKIAGTWSCYFLLNDDTDWDYYGTQWRSATITYTVKAPYKITDSILYSDCDWRAAGTVELDAEVGLLIGGNGGSGSTRFFKYNGLVGFDHPEGKPEDELSEYFSFRNDKGECLFSTKATATKSEIHFSLDSDDEATLMEIPYNYDWSVRYTSDVEVITLKKD